MPSLFSLSGFDFVRGGIKTDRLKPVLHESSDSLRYRHTRRSLAWNSETGRNR
jgi:hypothetical protein